MFQPRLTAPEYALIARAIYDSDPMYAGCAPDNDSARRYFAEHFAKHLERHGRGLFDRDRFIRAATTGVNAPAPRKGAHL